MRGLDLSHERGGPGEVVSVEMRHGLRCETWSLTGAIGDAVLADVWMEADPTAVVVIGHGGGGSRRSRYVTGSSAHWARHGFAVVAADAPFHGDRAGESMTGLPGTDPGLLVRWVRDHRMLVDVIEDRFTGLPIGYVGLSMGALFGVPLVASEERIAACVLALAGSTTAAYRARSPDCADALTPALELTDPVHFAPGIAPRPVLMLTAEQDELIPRSAADALYAALSPPKAHLVLPGTHFRWRHPGEWNRALLGFLGRSLG